VDQATHNKIVSFIWGIADDVLRDLFVRGKYRDVILPMFVLRRLDTGESQRSCRCWLINRGSPLIEKAGSCARG